MPKQALEKGDLDWNIIACDLIVVAFTSKSGGRLLTVFYRAIGVG